MYKVKIAEGKPWVVDQHGNQVANANVHKIFFPERKIETADGPVWVIDGSGKAEISVDGKSVSEVPLA
jgi:hypothetical protein